MSLDNDRDAEYYFVALGRQRGGYLDLLGLSPDATEVEIAAKDGEFRRDVEQRFKDQRKVFRCQYAEKKITEEELNAKIETISEEKSQSLAKFNELQDEYELIRDEQRLLEKEGRKDDSVAWMEMYRFFGQEKCGYLDLLGLPVDATEHKMAQQEAQYRKALEDARNDLEGKQERGEITQQQFDSDVKVLEEEKTTRLKELDDLRSEFDRMQSKRREECWRFVTKSRPISNISLDLLAELEQRYISKGKAGLYSKWASAHRSPDDPVDLSTIRRLVAERDLIALMVADDVWGKVRFTNRQYWKNRIAGWVQEISELGPHLQLEALPASHPRDDTEYSFLSEPTDLSVDHLEADELADISQQPKRSGTADRRPDLRAVLASLLAERMGKHATSDSEEEPATGEKGALPSLDAFLEFLEELSRTKGDE